MSVTPTERHPAAIADHDSPAAGGLSSALAALPLLDPPSDGWLRLRASLQQGTEDVEQTTPTSVRGALAMSRQARNWQSGWRVKRSLRLLAVAAIMALAALIVGVPAAWKAQPAAPIQSTVVGDGASNAEMARPVLLVVSGDDSPQAEALMIESARLQSVLSGSGASGRDAETLAIELALVDRMQWIDYLLADPEASAATREVLWRERVELLTQRLALSQRDSLIAASDAVIREVIL